MEGAVETGPTILPATPPRRGATWRRVERDWIDCDAYKSLPASAQAIYIHLVVVAHPKYGLGLSSRELASRVGRDERTTRRLVQVLEEAELIRVERTRGGSHRAVNRYWAKHADKAQGHLPGLARIERRRAAAEAKAEAKRTGVAATAPSAEPATSPAPVITPSSDLPALMTEQPSDEVLARLAVQLADDRHLDVEQARQELACYGAGTLAQLAAYYGLNAGAVAPVALPEDPEALAREIVHDYLRAWDLARVPYRRELELARSVVAHKGAGAWQAYQNAQRRLAALVRKWSRDKARPYTLLYLLPHLAAERALPPPGPDEPPN